jgi:HK97 family phage portal protein
VALSSIDADNAQTDYIRAFFNNGGQPAGILKVKGTIGQAKADELRSKWRSRLGRLLGRQHDITVLDDNADYQKVGANLDEISSEAIRSFTESRLAMAFDVPPLIIYAYVGLLRATYDNLKGAWQGFWTSTLKPLYKDWSDFLTWRLLVDFEGPDRIHAELVRLRWDFSEVEWLRESKSETHDLAAKSLQVGGITLNEYRARNGEQPDPAGDYYLRGFNVIPVQVGTVPDQEPEPAPEPAATDEEGKSLERKSRLRALKKTGGKQTIERRIEKDMRAMLMKHYKKIAAAVAA